MRKTRICEMLGIEYPVIQGGMAYIACAELAAAVSEAGGLGLISPTATMEKGGHTPTNLRKQIKKAKAITRKPFGVNISLEYPEHAREEIDVALEEGVKVFSVGAGSPAVLTKYFKQHGAKVFHAVSTIKHAKSAEAEGVDGVIASGVEAGGLLSPHELTTMALIPQIVDAVKIPVIAAGGIGDGRGFAAALMLGAEGVQLGTLFIATHECAAFPGFKEMIVKAKETDTVVTGRRAWAVRVLRNELADQILEMESRGATAKEILAFVGPGVFRRGILDGDLKRGSLAAGQVASMVKEIRGVAEVMQDLVKGCDAALSRWR